MICRVERRQRPDPLGAFEPLGAATRGSTACDEGRLVLAAAQRVPGAIVENEVGTETAMTNWDNNTVLLVAGVSVAPKGVLRELEASIEGTRNHRAVGVTPALESGPAPDPRVPPIRAHYQLRAHSLG